jgi:malate dehydrogenase (quinone)
MVIKTNDDVLDVAMIGSGIMSATLGTFLRELEPDWHIEIFEKLAIVATESSDARNNAGTGHAALCEMNYTPEKVDGSIDISKALKINEQFELSKQLWAYLVQNELIDGSDFIHSVPHMSFVTGDKDVTYLRKRYDALRSSPQFDGMEFTEDYAELLRWAPLVMTGRDPSQKVAATRTNSGTDVDFGALTRSMIDRLSTRSHVDLHLSHKVKSIRRQGKVWKLTIKDIKSGQVRIVKAKFVFIGAGGGSMSLLSSSGIPEAKSYSGFPVGGLWLRCTNPATVAAHHAKVYGKASVGAPPMSVPHLDARFIGGKQELLFGPFASFSTKFLKYGSYLDLPASINPDNVLPMMQVAVGNISLVRYLIQQLQLSEIERIKALREYYPEAKPEDWVLSTAGQRVQIIKKNSKGRGILEFGTELVRAHDGSIAALLGASPGASTAVSAMLDVLQQCFPEQIKSDAWQTQLRKMIPSYGQSLPNNPKLLDDIRKNYTSILELEPRTLIPG